ncbi:sulfatase family protein [Coraliomargarita akajimensis]|uniref:Sulfatase n=1 Tax=Coraliomargarita akajimensis (strain DSM 45221 / IAM 15411 / JCM 23193 / KCTC 12865 / 04OKA010-24) TaxID=583355 RepID=D5EN94_CORAD|nr:sulfatase-like hydrolase/transferase [Coraliomargarita akajimensis]ADE53529.1 sulfatase [Coraliomargarita akajimensis DSM 45221]
MALNSQITVLSLTSLGRFAAFFLLCSIFSFAASRPNIVVFFTDDLDFDEVPAGLYDLQKVASHTGMKQQGFYDDERPQYDQPQNDYFTNPSMLMPNLKRLAEEGMVLDRFYITSPICTPSRYSIMTGRFASRSAGFVNRNKPGNPACIDWSTNLDKRETSLSKALQANGYTTGIVGKWHNGGNAHQYLKEFRELSIFDPGVNDRIKEAQRIECEVMKEEQGYDFAASLQIGNVGALKAPRELRQENLEWVTQGALDFIDYAQEQGDKPFYLYVSLPLPHRQYYDSQARNPNASYWFERDPRGTPGGWLDEVSDCMPPREDVVRRCKEASIPMVNTMGTYIDDSLGAVLKKLEAAGLAENTLFVFTSDHQSRGKNTVGQAAHVPCVIRWPEGVEAGSRGAGLSSNVDLVSTILDVAECEEVGDVGLDGQTMLPMLVGSSDVVRESVYLEVMHTRGVVMDQFKYIACRAPADVVERMAKDEVAAMEQQRRRRVSWDGRENTPHNVSKGVVMDGDREFPHYFDLDQLYDLENDPFEQHNLAGDPRYADILTSMKAELSTYITDLPHSFGEF